MLVRMDEKTARGLGERMVEWYGRSARELPWRVNPTPYRVLVSEVMLQQTVVATVEGYFDRWMARWPDVESLARASEREVLGMWEGMGYYCRARHLHAAAGLIVREHGGRVPRERRALLALPGVGPYVAAAVRAFAFGQDEVALDANLVRVFMRLGGIEGRGTRTAVRREVMRLAQAGLAPGRASEYNQALMDFGSTICRPRRPACDECFVRHGCKAFGAGRQYDIPTPSKRRLKKIQTAVAVLRRAGEFYIQRRPPGGLFAGMWEFPGGKLRAGESPPQALARECREELGVACTPGPKLAEFVHYYTVFEVRLHAFLCPDPGGLPEDEEHRWVSLEALGDYPMPSANRQIVEALG
jgi:A/G-specific adenine glycosylase